MAALGNLEAILEAIRANVNEAWEASMPVSFGPPVEALAAPYAVVDLLPVAREFQTVRGVEETYRFRVTGRFPFPSSGNLLLTKAGRMRALIELLQPGPRYQGLATRPLVTQADPGETDDGEQRVYEVTLTFECRVEVEHH